MEHFVVLIEQGGHFRQIIAGAAAAGLLFGVIGLISVASGSSSGSMRFFGMCALFFSAVCLWTGVVDYQKRRMDVEKQIKAAVLKYPSEREHMAQPAYKEGRMSVGLGLAGSALPVFLGIIALRGASRRRWVEDPDGPYRPRTFAVLIGVLCGFGVIASGLGYGLKRGERDLDEQGWKVLRLRDALLQVDYFACTDPAFNPGPSKMPEMIDAQGRCAQRLIGNPLVEAPEVQALLDVPWMDDEGVRTALKSKLAGLLKPLIAKPAAVVATPPPPDPMKEAEAALISRAGECYAKLRKPKAVKGKMDLILSVSAKGEVSHVEQKKGGVKVEPLRKCVFAAAKAAAFPPAPKPTTVELALAFPPS